MRATARFFLPALLASVWCGSAMHAAEDGQVGRQLGDFQLRDHLGTQHALADFADRRLVVVAFLGTECPLSKLYGARLAEIAAKYDPAEVAFIGINSNQQDTPTEIQHYVRASALPFPILKDPGNRIADDFQAQRTPEIFVLDQQRVVRYWGPIDDQFGVGYARPEATRTFLTDALDALLAGKEVTVAEVEPVGCFIGRVARGPARGEITYSHQIARILQDRCVNCHRNGGIAPFALTSYDEAAGWAETIGEVIQDQRMPPWHASEKYGEFSNDARMPDEEKELVYRWVAGGVPEGDPNQLPPAREFAASWGIGQPDLIVSMPEPITIPATGVVPYQYVVLDPDLKEDTWVQASQALPGNPAVVHHILAFVQPPGTKFDPDRVGIGFEMLGGYVPGMPPMVLPSGTARLLPAGAKIVLQMHYTPNGSEQQDQSSVGFVFADPDTVEKTIQMGAAVNFDFEIPPHAESHTVYSSFRISHDSLLYSLTPHMHFRGKSFRYEAVYPNGAREILLDVPRYDFNWQHIYRLAEPKFLPAGTMMHCTAHFDNSSKNLANPDPTHSVRWGEQTWEEMMIGYYEVVLVEQDLTLPKPQIEQVSDDTYRVAFSYVPDRPVKLVSLAGTFNDWSNSQHRLQGPDERGSYAITLDLKAGTYHYKFVVDDDYWTYDPSSSQLIGVLHESLLVLGEPQTAELDQ